MEEMRLTGSRYLPLFDNLKIKQKLLALYMLAFIGPLILIMIALSIWLYDTLEKWQMEQTKTSLAQTASNVQEIIYKTEELSDSLYINRAVRDTIAHSFKSPQEVYDRYIELDFLDDFLHSNTEIFAFRYYTENQTIYDNSYFVKSTPSIKTTAWYKNAQADAGKIRWQMLMDEVTRKRMFALTRGMFSKPDGRFLGVLVIYLDTNRITRLLIGHENETFISVNGRIEFSSMPLPDSRRPGIIQTAMSTKTMRTLPTQWNGEKTVAIMDGLYNSQHTFMLITQIVPKKEMLRTTMIGILICMLILLTGSVISLLTILLFSRHFQKRVNAINGEIARVGANNFELGPRPHGTDEFVEIYDALASASASIKKLIDEVYQHKIEQEQLLSRQNDIRFKMLASQINPHFLFNTLETIRMQALSDGNKDVARTIKLLAKILRHNLDATDKPVPLTSEIEAVGNYLDIQHLRFGDRVSYDIDFATDVENVAILPLLIQPLAENSFIHGLEQRRPGGFISIVITSPDPDEISISIRDNGSGMTGQRLEEIRERLQTGTVENFTTSIGMVNVNQRIKLYYGEKYGIEIESEIDRGTTVTVRVPKILMTEEGESHG